MVGGDVSCAKVRFADDSQGDSAMTRFLRAALVMATGLASLPAAAADLGGDVPPKPSVYAPAPPPTWSGFYLGAGLGGRWTDAEWTTTAVGEGPTSIAPFATGNPGRFGLSGSNIRGYLGYNWQISKWVLGLEADLGWGDNERRRIGIPGTLAVVGPGVTDTASVKDEWDASLRARFGFLVSPDLLLYATGGASWTRREVSASCAGPLAPVSLCPPFVAPFGVIGTRTQSASDIVVGWTAGGGLEWRLAPDWILRGEYRFSEYQSTEFTFFGTSNVNPEQFSFSVDQQTHLAYVGLSYLFPTAAVASAPDPAPTRAPAIRRGSAPDWSGIYIGPHIGGVLADTELTDITANLGPPSIPGYRFRLDPDGLLAGGQVGFNYQTGAWVLGIEAQGAWSNATGSNLPLSAPPPFDGGIRIRSDIDWLATVTGRIGLSLGNALPYVKAGWALAGESYSADVSFRGASLPVTGSDRTRSGWVVGAGLEWSVAGPWSARFEYSFMDFGRETRSITSVGQPPTPFDVDQEVHSFTFGVNYRFGPVSSVDRP
jgi:outer membrane immunogenic protein